MPDFKSLDSLFHKTVADAVASGEPIKIGDAAKPAESAVEKPATEPVPEVKVEAKPSPLAERIRADREARAAKARDASEATDLRTKLQGAQAVIDSYKNQVDPVGDPVAWAKLRGMSKEDQALFAQALLYDIVPDKAPADMRIRLFEMKQAREAKAREVAETERRNTEAVQRTNAMINQYAEDVESEVATFTAGSFPNSEDWFGDDTRSYVQSLLATARNLSETANKAGQRVDISPSAVAKALEQEVAKRMERRDARAATRKPIVAETKPGDGKLPNGEGETASTKGLGSGGMPRPKATTDAERMARAAEAAFGGR